MIVRLLTFRLDCRDSDPRPRTFQPAIRSQYYDQVDPSAFSKDHCGSRQCRRGTLHRACRCPGCERPQQSHQRRVYWKREPEHDRLAGIPGSAGRAGARRVRREYGQLRLQDSGTVSRRKPAQDKVNAFYAKQKPSGQYRGCEAYNDFREVLGREDIDAVAIVVPDHWHGLMVVMASQAGKDMYCEKPLSLTVRQGRKMVEAVQQHNRVLQTGSHYRSSPANRLACELVRNGRIGQVQRIITQVAEQNAVDPGPGWQPMPVPEGFDYEMWLGPAPHVPYHKDRCLYRFRFNLDYSGGQTTNFGAHSNDIAQWGLGADETGPVEFEDAGSEWPAPGGLFNTATKVSFRARYASGVELVCATTQGGFGTRFEGTEGWVEYGYKGVKTSPESLATSTIKADEIRIPISNPERQEDASATIFPTTSATSSTR